LGIQEEYGRQAGSAHDMHTYWNCEIAIKLAVVIDYRGDHIV
jgi:hypothetical protein